MVVDLKTRECFIKNKVAYEWSKILDPSIVL